MGERRPRSVGGTAMEGPACLAEALDQPGFGEQLEVARDARLRLAKDLGEVGNRELGLGDERQEAQARVLGRGLEAFEQR